MYCHCRLTGSITKLSLRKPSFSSKRDLLFIPNKGNTWMTSRSLSPALELWRLVQQRAEFRTNKSVFWLAEGKKTEDKRASNHLLEHVRNCA